jgi:diguanylate cyclase (GGDEF)-like protein
MVARTHAADPIQLMRPRLKVVRGSADTFPMAGVGLSREMVEARARRAAMEMTGTGLLVVDPSLRVLWANDTAIAAVGGGDPIGRQATDYLHPDDLGTAARVLSQFRSVDHDLGTEQAQLQLPLGRQMRLRRETLDENGDMKVEWFFAIIRMENRLNDPEFPVLIMRLDITGDLRHLGFGLQRMRNDESLHDVASHLVRHITNENRDCMVAAVWWDRSGRHVVNDRIPDHVVASLTHPGLYEHVLAPDGTFDRSVVPTGHLDNETDNSSFVPRGHAVTFSVDAEHFGNDQLRAVKQAAISVGMASVCVIPLRRRAADGGALLGVILYWSPYTYELSLEPQLAVTIASDVFALALASAEQSDRLRHVAVHDPLTGVLNRSGLDEAWTSTPYPVAILIDLDGFKPVNDTFGHLCGDRVLVEVAQRLLRSCREGDSVGRLGGDEFVILMSADPSRHADPAAVARRVCELISQPIAAVPGDDGDGESIDVCVGASAGIAIANPNDSLMSCLSRADIELYAAKRARVRTTPITAAQA